MRKGVAVKICACVLALNVVGLAAPDMLEFYLGPFYRVGNEFVFPGEVSCARGGTCWVQASYAATEGTAIQGFSFALEWSSSSICPTGDLRFTPRSEGFPIPFFVPDFQNVCVDPTGQQAVVALIADLSPPDPGSSGGLRFYPGLGYTYDWNYTETIEGDPDAGERPAGRGSRVAPIPVPFVDVEVANVDLAPFERARIYLIDRSAVCPGGREILTAATVGGADAIPTRLFPGRTDPGLDIVSEGVDEDEFIRGDANVDGNVQLSDAIAVLSYLFDRRELPCMDAGDANADGRVDIADVTKIIDFLFNGGSIPPPNLDTGAEKRDGGLPCDFGLTS